MRPSHKVNGWGAFRSLLCLSPLFILVPWYAVRNIYGNPPFFFFFTCFPPITHFLFYLALPEPITAL
jgi:hypothetical protein